MFVSFSLLKDAYESIVEQPANGAAPSMIFKLSS